MCQLNNPEMIMSKVLLMMILKQAYDDGYWLGNKGHGEASPGRAGFSVHRNTTDVKSTATGNNVRH